MCDGKSLTKGERAKNLRYKKAAMEMLELQKIGFELGEISEECDGIRYYMDDDATLLAAMDGDEDDAYEFKMLFSDLSARCEQLYDAINNYYVNEHFDDFFVGILGNKYNVVGYDSYEEDYYGLTQFEGELAQGESGKRLARLTKDQLLSVAGQCVGVAISFLNVKYKYDYLKATFDILKDENTSILQMVKEISTAYEKASEDGFNPYEDSIRTFDRLAAGLPERYWIE